MIVAWRFPGADASAFVDFIILAAGGGPAEQRAAQVAGKDVIKITVAGSTKYLYPQGDVVWGVVAEEPAPTEILEALP